ncbi:ParB/RepB/Spo0J family partition protein [soil metagenome]
MAKKALGRGLGALIKRPGSDSGATAPPVGAQTWGAQGSADSPVAAGLPEGDRVLSVARERVAPSPMQPRKTFRDDHLVELVDSIREHGVVQPLIVREVGGDYELIAGERRWRAAAALGLAEVPVVVRVATDRDVLELALIENLQREDLNPVEEAEAYVRLAREFAMTQDEIARRVGKNRATVANAMRLLDLDGEVRGLLENGTISTGHAKVLLGEKDPARQRLFAGEIVRKGLTVRAAEKLLQSANLEGGTRAGTSRGRAPQLEGETAAAIRDVTNRLRDRFATHVSVHHGPKKGRIEIDYYGNDDLDRILAIMGATERTDP